MIEYHLGQEACDVFDGSVELDESYFGGVRKGKRGRSAAGKIVVFMLSYLAWVETILTAWRISGIKPNVY